MTVSSFMTSPGNSMFYLDDRRKRRPEVNQVFYWIKKLKKSNLLI